MSYVKTSWVARVGTALNRFLKANESSSSVELTADPTGVSTAGTPFTADNMNKIEQGIYDNSVDLDTIKDGGSLQGLSSASEPTFAKLTLTTSTYGSQTLAVFSIWYPGPGFYSGLSINDFKVEINTGSAWKDLSSVGSAIISDGSNIRIRNLTADTATIHYRKFS